MPPPPSPAATPVTAPLPPPAMAPMAAPNRRRYRRWRPSSWWQQRPEEGPGVDVGRAAIRRMDGVSSTDSDARPFTRPPRSAFTTRPSTVEPRSATVIHLPQWVRPGCRRRRLHGGLGGKRGERTDSTCVPASITSSDRRAEAERQRYMRQRARPPWGLPNCSEPPADDSPAVGGRLSPKAVRGARDRHWRRGRPIRRAPFRLLTEPPPAVAHSTYRTRNRAVRTPIPPPRAGKISMLVKFSSLDLSGAPIPAARHRYYRVTFRRPKGNLAAFEGQFDVHDVVYRGRPGGKQLRIRRRSAV